MINLLLLPFSNVLTTSITLLVIFVWWLHHKLTFWRRQGLPQSVLHVKDAVTSVMFLADYKLVQEKGKIVGNYEIVFPTLLLADPLLVNEVLVKDFKKFSDHRLWMPKGTPFNQSLFLLPYKQWKPMRSSMTTMFTGANIKKMLFLVDEATDSLLNHLNEKLKRDDAFDVRHLIECSMMDVVLRCIFGTKIDTAKDPNNPIVMHSRMIFGTEKSIPQMLAFSLPNLMWKFGVTAFHIKAINFLVDLSNEIIKERKTGRNLNHKDLIQLMIDAEVEVEKDSKEKKKLTTTEIIDNCILFFIGGYDTVAATIVNNIYHLAIYPDIQQQLFEEIDQELKINDIDFDKMYHLKLLDAFINEVFRMLPSVARTERKTNEDCYLGNVFVPKGTYITIPTYAVHHDADYWDEHDVFKIERFLPENRKDIRPGTFVPFADGPRNCIGYRFAYSMIKIFLVKLLQRYKIVKTDKTKHEPVIGSHVTFPIEMVVKLEKKI